MPPPPNKPTRNRNRQELNMKIGAMFPSNYLKATDVETDTTLTIDSVEMHTFKTRDGSEELKPLVMFREEKRGLILNKTNTKLIARALQSDDTDDWSGMQVTLYATEVEFGGDIVDAIRVRGKAPVVDDDDITF
jgi:hypothetical protein